MDLTGLSDLEKMKLAESELDQLEIGFGIDFNAEERVNAYNVIIERYGLQHLSPCEFWDLWHRLKQWDYEPCPEQYK